MDPKDILENFHPNAAFPSPADPRDHQWSEVGFGVALFDWNTGYDVEEELASVLGQPGFKLPVKNQGGSGSCGGQAEGNYGGAVYAYHLKQFVERSAKFPYAQVYYPGGGSADRDLARIATQQGFSAESDCVSYENGNPPTEAFMERVGDITAQARTSAALEKASSYVNVNIDIDSMAQAIQANHGIRIGITGANNGSWLSAEPVPPTENADFWFHWLYVGKAKMRNGKKMVAVFNSWGPTVGEGGWQWIGEDYINLILQTCPNGRGIWAARAVVVNDSPAVTLHHDFATDIHYGQSGDEVKALQQALQIDGEFPLGTPCTGFYGDITRQSVLKFQMKYQVDTNVALLALNGKSVGPKTRAELNKLYNN